MLLKGAQRTDCRRRKGTLKALKDGGTDEGDSKVRERDEEAGFNGHVGRLS